ncbi:Protein of unknown function (DUF4237) [Streptoalloteichus tenebrarius]|uniref:TNT domain-containing protein n=1 Tax=Streptoalloteichus tenebrarius (strain ATCC 17920 / DSM 40477 / JCM 4838 / CBS 697.72 / NBRC 16177 / NCIMB 11028 / NRRL B-12390 / A12253. 1 / ISP 5477) TaxID=1933 RepID=A0ABT1HXW5_STRSD|nr:glycohydrolase toxin TNT-related protein [Streptoalloteichus tenebrarius]MCP2260354.1 Protein of unknown function (DUF4237) [Streptoalloteichus tenebrarius]BFF02539.1 hypothetical protein GCM10020241_42140 [Streptoalloteichus tenebrarius]
MIIDDIPPSGLHVVCSNEVHPTLARTEQDDAGTHSVRLPNGDVRTVGPTEVESVFDLLTVAGHGDELAVVTPRQDESGGTSHRPPEGATRLLQLRLSRTFSPVPTAYPLPALPEDHHQDEVDLMESPWGRGFTQALLGQAPQWWTQISIECRAIAGQMELLCLVTFGRRPDEVVRHWAPPPDISQWFHRLRLITYRPGEGAWFTARYRFVREGSYASFEFDRVNEPGWQYLTAEREPLLARRYADDLLLFPRDPAHTPDWLAAAVHRGHLDETRHLLLGGGTPRPADANGMAAVQPAPLVEARLFDHLDDNGHPRAYRPPLGVAERRAVLEYLRNGTVVLSSRGQSEDLLDPGRGATVPMAFLTDGTWVWSAAHAYYLEHHGLTPPLELLGHIRARRYEPPRQLAENTKRRATALVMGMPGPDPGIQEEFERAYWWIRWYARYYDLCPLIYSIGQLRPDAWCLVPEGDEYAVFWNSADQRYGEARFGDVGEAARYLVGTLISYVDDYRRHPEDIFDDFDCPIPVLGDDPPLTHYAEKLWVQLNAGAQVVRYGTPDGNTTFLSGSRFDQLNLPPEYAEREVHSYYVMADTILITGVTAGGARAYLFPWPVAEHLAAGHLVEIDPAQAQPTEEPPTSPPTPPTPPTSPPTPPTPPTPPAGE